MEGWNDAELRVYAERLDANERRHRNTRLVFYIGNPPMSERVLAHLSDLGWEIDVGIHGTQPVSLWSRKCVWLKLREA